MGEVVLAVFAHPDDEVLGCGGTLVKHVAAGAVVHARFVGTGVGSRGDSDAAPRLAEMRAAAKALGLSSAEVHPRPPEDQQFDAGPQMGINQRVEAWLRDLRPTIVYTHTLHDINRDHQVVSAAVMVATRPWVYGPCAVYGCEIPGCSLIPDEWRRLSDSEATKKMLALACYASEAQPSPLPRSKDAVLWLMRNRGVEAGWPWAEAFETLRNVK